MDPSFTSGLISYVPFVSLFRNRKGRRNGPAEKNLDAVPASNLCTQLACLGTRMQIFVWIEDTKEIHSPGLSMVLTATQQSK